MLKAEVIKTFKERLIYFIFIGIIGVFIYSAKIYHDNATYDSYKHFGYQVVKYETKEDVELLREEVKKEMLSPELKKEERDEMQRTLVIYDYLLNENYIEYKDLIDYSGMNVECYTNYYSFSNYLSKMMRLAVCVLLGIMAGIMVPMDFQKRMHRSIYSRDCSRNKILGTKYKTWLLISMGIVLVVSIITSLLGFCYQENEVKGILFASTSNAFYVNYPVFCLLNFVEFLIRTIIYGTIIFGISLFCENSLFTICPTIIINGIIFASFEIEKPFLTVLTQGGLAAYEYSGTNSIYILFAYLIYFAVTASIVIGGLIYFNKKNIN